MSGASFSPDDVGPSLVLTDGDGNPIMVSPGTIVSVSGDLTGTPPTFSMPSCQTCRHWGGESNHIDGRRECERLSGDLSARGALAGIEGYDLHGVSFDTDASFGCTEHQPRPTEENPK